MQALELIVQFTRQALDAAGFIGWVPFASLRESSCPRAPGVYVVVRPDPTIPVDFTPRSCGGWFKGRDPTSPVDELRTKWIDGAEVVYIGMAGAGRGSSRGLRQRLIEYADFGAGKPAAHSGGRRIWQLADCKRLLVAWREEPHREAGAVESEMIAAFIGTYGRLPFANGRR
jgi:hypothetical protein